MPELPEIETVKRQLAPRLVGQKLVSCVLRRKGLREPFPDIQTLACGQTVHDISRRSKYLIITLETGSLLLHLGMSGHLRWLPAQDQQAILKVGKHDHLDLVFTQGRVRLNDARRFGAVLWQPMGQTHKALSELGPEPLDEQFNGAVLYTRLRNRKVPIKVAIMDPKVVVGVGNIYASEALFRAKIDPRKEAGKVSAAKCNALAMHIQAVLTEGIAKGGSTLRDFHGVGGETGTFSQSVSVYGRGGQACRVCNSTLRSMTLGGRGSVWCPNCQK